METELLDNIRKLCQVESIPVSENIKNFVLSKVSKGAYILNSPIVTDGEFIFEESEFYWIDNIEIEIELSQSSVALSIEEQNGECKILNVNSRTRNKGNYESLVFDVHATAKNIKLSLFDESKKVTIKQILISGNRLKNITSLMETIASLWGELDISYEEAGRFFDSNISEKKEEIKKLNEQITNLTSSINEMESTNEITKSQLDSTRKFLNDDRKELERTKKAIDESQQLTRELESKLSKLNDVRTGVLDDISHKKTELDKVDSELNRYQQQAGLYSEDFSAYKEEVSTQNKIYLFFLTVFIICLSCIVYNIYNSAISLVDSYQFNFDLWTLLVSRLPIISINIFILGIFSTLLYQSINLITNNFNKIASVKQIAYLVKECTDSQALDMDISKEDLLKLRIEKKMELIREHINSSHINGK